MSLGARDYGLYGLVGGVVGFVTFFNSILSMAVSRFYAYEIGRASVSDNRESAIKDCRSWFSTAVFLHTIVPLSLVAIGWPIGEYAVLNWLTIPSDRVAACLWVLRFSLVSCLAGMMNVPFNAMYTAKQYIAELTIYSIAASIIRVAILYYMVSNPGDWLTAFGFIMMLLSVVPNLIIAVRAMFVFPECRLIVSEMINWSRFSQLGSYAGWVSFGMGAWVCRQNGIPIFINEFLGAAYNSSMTVSNAIAGHAMSLSSCLTGAFAPAITNARGAGNDVLMRKYSLMTSKIGTLLILVFAIPISLELDEITKLWLKTPPPGILALSRYVLLALVFERMAEGSHLAVSACGKIGKYQLITCMGIFSFIPLVWLLLHKGLGVHAIGIALCSSVFIHMSLRVLCAARLVKIGVWEWITRVALPVFAILICAAVAGALSCLLLQQSVLRIAATFLFSMVAFALSGWLYALDGAEKSFVLQRFYNVFRR